MEDKHLQNDMGEREADGRMWINRYLNEVDCIWLVTAKLVRTLLQSEGKGEDFINGAIDELRLRHMSN